MKQQIYALRLTDEEAKALLALLSDQCTSRVLARLSPHHRALAIDQRGFGDS